MLQRASPAKYWFAGVRVAVAGSVIVLMRGAP